MVDIKA